MRKSVATFEQSRRFTKYEVIIFVAVACILFYYGMRVSAFFWLALAWLSMRRHLARIKANNFKDSP